MSKSKKIAIAILAIGEVVSLASGSFILIKKIGDERRRIAASR